MSTILTRGVPGSSASLYGGFDERREKERNRENEKVAKRKRERERV